MLVAAVPACTLLAGTTDLRIAADVESDGGSRDDTLDGAVAAEPDVATSPDAPSGSNDAAPLNYRDMVLADQPLAYWRMGQLQGSEIADETGRGNSLLLTGTTNAAPGAIAGDPDTALAFDGLTTIAQAKDGGSFVFGAPATFSVEAWVKRTPRSSRANFEHLFGATTGLGSSRLGYLTYLSNVGGPDLQFQWRPAAGVSYTASGPIPSSGFVHLVSVFDGTSLQLFVDGASTDSEVVVGSLPFRPASFVIGGDDDRLTESRFSGVIDEVAVYDRALSPPEIALHFENGRGPM